MLRLSILAKSFLIDSRLVYLPFRITMALLVQIMQFTKMPANMFCSILCTCSAQSRIGLLSTTRHRELETGSVVFILMICSRCQHFFRLMMISLV